MTDTKELRRLALLATPGPRATYNENEGMGQQYMPLWSVANEEYHNPTNEDALCFDATVYSGCKEDADLIAALSPSVVLALLDEIEELRKIKAAAMTLIAMRGRHNTETAYKRLVESVASPQPEKEQS